MAAQTLTREADFKELVRTHFEELPPQQQAIADHLIEHLREVPFLSIPELAQQVGVSEATVVRFAQRIGFEGFAELKMVLLDLVRGRVIGERAAAPRDGNEDLAGDEGDTLAAVARLERQNIERMVEGSETREFRAAAAALFKADHVYSFGLGISSYLADVSTYLLTQIGLRATSLSTRFSSPREQLVVLRPSDLLFIFSFPPYSRQTIAMLEETAARGLPTLAVTDKLTAPAVGLARHAFVVPSHNMMFTNSVASVLVLLNALTTEIAVRHQGHAFEALSRINRILSEDEDLIHDT